MRRSLGLEGADAGRTIVVLTLCALAGLVEGFDIQATGSTAPSFGPAYHMSSSQLGFVFSGNSLGLFLGAALGGRLSDQFGRFKVLIGSIFIFGVFSALTTVSPSTSAFILMRILTGFGLGGAMPNILAIAAETGAVEGRATRVTWVAASIPIGGTLSPLLFWAGGNGLDWRIVFWVGAAAPVLLALVMARTLRGLGDSRPVDHATGIDRSHTANALFGGGRTKFTLLLWIGFYFTLVCSYLLNNWLPTLLVRNGFSAPEAALSLLTFSLGGAIGGVLLSMLMNRVGQRLVVSLCYLGAALMTFTIVGPTGTLAMLAATLTIGFFLVGAQYLLYGFAPCYYPLAMRGTGVGWSVAAGRLGSITGPILAATILTSGGAPSKVMLSLLPVLAAAFVAVLLLSWRPAPEVV